MTKLSNHPVLLALKQEFGKREAAQLRQRAAAERAQATERKVKLIKAAKNLFTPPPVLRFS